MCRRRICPAHTHSTEKQKKKKEIKAKEHRFVSRVKEKKTRKKEKRHTQKAGNLFSCPNGRYVVLHHSFLTF